MSSVPFEVEVLQQFKGKLLQLHERPKRERARKDFVYFLKHVLGFMVEPFHKDAFKFQLDNNRTLILAPRGHGKSTILTIGYALWLILRNPNVRILVVSATDDLAFDMVRRIRGILESFRWKAMFGDWRGPVWADDGFVVNRRSIIAQERTVAGAGILSTIQSGHYEVVICDDVVSEDNSRSEKVRARVSRKFKQSLMPTLMPGASIHVIGTRYHWQDLYGELTGKAGMMADVLKVYKAVGNDGAALWEDFQPLNNRVDERGKIVVKGLLQIKSDIGTIIFNAQYQNDTEAMKGKLFKLEWFERNAYDPGDIPEKAFLVQAVDPAVGQKAHNDYCVISTGAWDRKSKTLYVIAVRRGKWSFDGQVKRIKSEYREWNKPKHPVTKVGIESNAAQDFIYQHLRKNTRMPVIRVRAIKDKIARAEKYSAQVENGRVRYPKHMLNSDVIEEFLLFPEGEHDDIVDSNVHLLAVAQRKKSKALAFSAR